MALPLNVGTAVSVSAVPVAPDEYIGVFDLEATAVIVDVPPEAGREIGFADKDIDHAP